MEPNLAPDSFIQGNKNSYESLIPTNVPKFLEVSSITPRFLVSFGEEAGGSVAEIVVASVTSSPKTTAFDTSEIQQRAVAKAKRRHLFLGI